MMPLEQRQRLMVEFHGAINVELQKRFAAEVIGACVSTWNTWLFDVGTVERAQPIFNDRNQLPMLDIINKYGLSNTPLYDLIRDDLTLVELPRTSDAQIGKHWEIKCSGLLLRLLEGEVTEVSFVPRTFWLEKSEAEVRAYYQQLLDQPRVDLNIKKDLS